MKARYVLVMLLVLFGTEFSTLPKGSAVVDDCAKYYGKGYCVDYIQQKVGRRPRGDAATWPANINNNDVRRGDVAIFRSMGGGHGHVAYVESVNLDRNRRPTSINVTEMNAHGPLDKCARGPDFGRVTNGSYNFSKASGFWRP